MARRVGGIIGGVRYTASPIYAPIVPELTIVSVGGDNALTQYEQDVVIELTTSPNTISSVTIDGVDHTIINQTPGVDDTRTITLARVEPIGGSGTKSVIVIDEESNVASRNISYTRTHTYPALAPGNYDSNSIFVGSTFPAGSYFQPLTDFTGFNFKSPYTSWADAPLQNDINDYIAPPPGVEGEFIVIMSIIAPNGDTDTWEVTAIVSADSVPDAFSFISATNVAINTVVTSNPVEITGINVPATVSIDVGEYSINNGPWLSTPSFITNEQLIAVRHTSSSSYETPRVSTLTIGGVAGTFTSTTEEMRTVPGPINFTPQTGRPLNSIVASNTQIITLINVPVAISIANGEYSIDGSDWTNSPGTISLGQSVQVRLTSAATVQTMVVATLTVGGVQSPFSVTTVLADISPNPIVFNTVLNAPINTLVESNSQTISGINVPVTISVTNGQYSINSSAWTSSTGTISSGQTVRVRHSSSASYETGVTTTLAISDVPFTFTSVTVQALSTPNQFAFTPQPSVALNTTIVSNSQTILGINVAVSIAVTNGEYSINGGSWTSANGSITNGQTVRVRHPSSALYQTTVTSTLTIGGVSATFQSTTLASVVDTTPDPFTFSPQNDVSLNSVVISNSITVTGINAAASISVTGGEYSINGGGFITLPGTIVNGQTVRVRHTSSFNYDTLANTTLTIGGISGTFSSRTLVQTIPEQDEQVDYTNDELVQFILDNNGNPPNTNFGTYTHALHVDSILINYVANSILPKELDDDIQINQIHAKLLRHYIAGQALRADTDMQNRALGAEELALYQDELRKLDVPNTSNHIPENELVTTYNGLG